MAAARKGAVLEVVTAFPVDSYWTDAYLLDSARNDALRADTAARAREVVEHAARIGGPAEGGARPLPGDGRPPAAGRAGAGPARHGRRDGLTGGTVTVQPARRDRLQVDDPQSSGHRAGGAAPTGDAGWRAQLGLFAALMGLGVDGTITATALDQLVPLARRAPDSARPRPGT
ncbi:hypothetical protein [Modestobacter sp. I12A-02662]|uniref:hypothetical protein n=1 Tax=Modestobacter sp. I12A-02662 TaxID=1730496 RepID=UPI0034DEC8E1